MHPEQPDRPARPERAQAERDIHTFQVADHGVDPSPMPVPVATETVAASTRRGARHASANRRGSDSVRPGRPGESRGSRANDRFGLRDLLVWCGIPVLVVLALRILVFPLYWIPSSSMMDTILPDDRVVTVSTHVRPTSKLQRGDIIVFKDPANWLGAESTSGGDGYLIKRLIGLPGDTVACDGPGNPVTINGVAIDETSYIRPGSDPSAMAFSVTVTEGHVFVLGDNRARSADSRFHQDDGDNGLVPMEDIAGTALLTYWPLDRISLLDAHHEVFDAVPSDGSATAGAANDVTAANSVTAEVAAR
ncbi:signal peptidase [Bifidobacterium sp. DSM 109958]|uniref:Signal peptidase I n=1 Tax=Bifidobacterium moraviense TaxID=2675323 RepID=A0A7Y0F2Q6_9BIFI|nr:signal peptidase I [Bifidobacterium sp. DSM 109958]NMN00799.1 signal peptidase [Bifidobacterium sp. DSM 109958]